jgi:hypothetical protein
MSTTTNELPESAAAAVAEATRIAAQAARNSTETAKASFEATRSYVGETSVIGREMLEGWSTQGEAVLKTAFDAQSAAFEAGLNLFDLGLKGNRKAVEQFSMIVKRTQQATLESWQSAVKAASMATETTKR